MTTLQFGIRNSIVTLPAFNGCYRAKRSFDQQESGLRRLSSLTHRGLAGSHRISTVDTYHAALLLFRHVV